MDLFIDTAIGVLIPNLQTLRTTFVVVPLGEGARGRLLGLLELVKRVAVGSKSQFKFCGCSSMKKTLLKNKLFKSKIDPMSSAFFLIASSCSSCGSGSEFERNFNSLSRFNHVFARTGQISSILCRPLAAKLSSGIKTDFICGHSDYNPRKFCLETQVWIVEAFPVQHLSFLTSGCSVPCTPILM